MSIGRENDLAARRPGEVSRLLEAVGRGEPQASERLFSLVYQDLRSIARRQVGGAAGTRGPSASSVVHEACLRLIRRGELGYNDSEHFYAVATRAMRQILVDRARARLAVKRGVDPIHDPLEEWNAAPASAQVPPEDLLSLDAALETLEREAPRQARIVEWHFFGGLTFAEIGEALDCSERTVKRDWRSARALLHGRLASGA